MNVELPAEGCNVINSASSFYNYSPDSRTRDTYIIYDGKAIKQASTYNQYGYNYSGECLITGDLVYKPEYKDVFFPALSIIFAILIFYLAFKLILGRFWRSL